MLSLISALGGRALYPCRKTRHVCRSTKAAIAFVMYVRARGTTKLPLNGFSLNLAFEYFSSYVSVSLSPQHGASSGCG